MKTKEVSTILGVWTLKRPKAGARNRALERAETATGVKQTTFYTTLLPMCILKRPADVDDTVPIEQLLNDLELEDYDALVKGLQELLADESEPTEQSEEKKKSSKNSSEQVNSLESV